MPSGLENFAARERARGRQNIAILRDVLALKYHWHDPNIDSSPQSLIFCLLQTLLHMSVFSHNDVGVSEAPSGDEVVVRVPQHFQNSEYELMSYYSTMSTVRGMSGLMWWTMTWPFIWYPLFTLEYMRTGQGNAMPFGQMWDIRGFFWNSFSSLAFQRPSRSSMMPSHSQSSRDYLLNPLPRPMKGSAPLWFIWCL